MLDLRAAPSVWVRGWRMLKSKGKYSHGVGWMHSTTTKIQSDKTSNNDAAILSRGRMPAAVGLAGAGPGPIGQRDSPAEESYQSDKISSAGRSPADQTLSPP